MIMQTLYVKVLGQKYSSDRWLPSDTSKYPTSTINHSSATMPPLKTGYLTEFEKGQIVALRKKEISFSEIGELLHYPKSTILSFHNRFQKRGDANTLPKPGRPRIITPRTCHHLVRESKKACHQTLSELCNDVVPQGSIATVKRALASVDIKKWRARKRVLLRDEHAVKRLAWVMEYKDLTKEDFEGVIFSDECMVEKLKEPKGTWGFRTREAKLHKDCLHGVTKGPGIKLMVWACIWGRNKGPLIPIFEKSVDRFVYYIGVLEDGLIDVWQEVEDTVGDPIFQQDGAKIHTARDTMAWFAENNLNIQVME